MRCERRAKAQGKHVGGRFKLSEREVRELAELYKQGVSVARIAKRLGVSRNTVYRYLERAGLKQLKKRARNN